MQSVRAMMDECRAAESCKAPSLAAAVSLCSENAQLAPKETKKNQRPLIVARIGLWLIKIIQEVCGAALFLKMSERCHSESKTVESLHCGCNEWITVQKQEVGTIPH